MGTGIVAHLSRDDLKLDKENDKERFTRANDEQWSLIILIDSSLAIVTELEVASGGYLPNHEVSR